MTLLIVFLAGLIFGVVLTTRLRQPPSPPIPTQTVTAEPVEDMASDRDAAADATGTHGEDRLALPGPQPSDESPRDRLFRLRREVEGMDDRIRHPEDLLQIPEFREGVALLCTDAFKPEEIAQAIGSPGYVLPSMAALCLQRRTDVDPSAALDATMPFGSYPLNFLLDALQSRDEARTLPQVLRHAREWWWESPPVRQRIRDYLRWAESRAPGDATMRLDDLDDFALQEMEAAFKAFQEPVLAPYLQQVLGELTARRERRTLGAIGRLWAPVERERIVRYPELEDQTDRLFEMLTAASPKTVLLSGEHGTGKTVLVDRLLARLHEAGWLVFEASAMDVLAGQKFIGELEGRVREMLGALNRPKALWRVQDFFDLLHKGSHQQDPRGILDLLLPAIERGELLMVGELTPRQISQLLLARPALRHHAEMVLLTAPDETTMRDLLSRWADARATRHGRTVADARLLGEAQRMAVQFFPEQHEPGRSLRLLEESLQSAAAADPAQLPLNGDALLRAIAARSGLPMDVIDDRQSLSLDTLREFFRKRVIGQDEAVECLVDRIAMLKAGLVDSARPIGVFLFAGPTGTGKTELAKTLGELLFGSGERLLRLDMSEYQSDDGAWRLIDDARDGSTRSLVARIREQPFSVVLLDEFEKAHPKVWDLFLQVFDDGRLSDRSGNVADFRHSIIILTSNAGSTLSRSAGPGFTSAAGGYSRGAVEKALYETFRREFLNRLDRIVLFNPLDRGLMREILHKELERAMTRRGLRNRDWAVEWEPSAIEFLLDRGFTLDLGARPLRRAIEHHLLAPLARSIVEHRAPQGDQFLFVRSAGGRLEVEFIDPNAPAPAAAAPTPAHSGERTDLRTLIYAPDHSNDAIAGLHRHCARLSETLASSTWTDARDRDFAAMNATDFWSQSGRFEVLDRIERRDRIESALDTAQRLDERLARDGGNPAFVARCAQLLWLLDIAADAVSAREPQDALLALAASESDLKRDAAQTRLWWQQILSMYMAWAERRNMRVEVLEQDAERCRARLAVGGFGAYALLRHEHGLHVFEQEQEGENSTRRNSVQVRCAPDLPGRNRPNLLIGEEDLRIARRYRAEPSPLVRDATRGWRSGRFDRVLAGEFDVIVGE